MSFYAGMMAGLNKRKNPLDEDDEKPEDVQNRLIASSFDDEDEDDGPPGRKDSYDEMMAASKFPQISAPSIAPLNPFELSPPQPAEPPGQSGGDRGQHRSNPLDYSIESGGNTMSSYYANNNWDNTAAEEDDDEDSDYHKSDVLNLLEEERQVVAPKKRVTRMRSKSTENLTSGEKPKKTKGKRKKSKKQQPQQTRPTGPVRSDSYGKYSSSELNYGALFPSSHILIDSSAQDIEVLSLNDVDGDDDDEDDDEDEEDGEDSDSGASQDMDSYDGTGEDPHASLERSGASSSAVDMSARSEDQVMAFSNDESPVKPSAAAAAAKSGTVGRTVQFNNLSPSGETHSSFDLSDKEGSENNDEGTGGGRRHSVLSDDDEDDNDSGYKPSNRSASQGKRNPLDASLEFPKASSSAASSNSRANPLDYDSEEEERQHRERQQQQKQQRAVSAQSEKDSYQSSNSSSSSRGPVVAQGSPSRPIVKLPSASPATSAVRKELPRELDLGEPEPEVRQERAVESKAAPSAVGSSRRPIMTEQEKAEDRRQRIEQIKANMLAAKRERMMQYSPKAGSAAPPFSEEASSRSSSMAAANKKSTSQNRVSFDQTLIGPGAGSAAEVDGEEEVTKPLQIIMPTRLYEEPEGSSTSPSSRSAGSANPLSSSVNKNPLYNSATSLHTDYSGHSIAGTGQSNNPILTTLPITLELPALSEYAAESGVIFEGYLGKKSKTTGMFQKRYFVLSESANYFAVLRIYASAVETKWGVVPINLRTSIPIGSIESVTTTASQASKGIEFVIKFSPSSLEAPDGTRFGGSQAGSESGSVFSSFYGSSSKQSVLHAEDAEARLLWVTILNKVLSIFLDNLPEQH